MGLLTFLSRLGQSNAQGPLKTGAPTPVAPPQAPLGAAEADPSQAPITVTGGPRDPWQPHKTSVLGDIADAIAAYSEQDNDVHPFADKNDRKNMTEAMQDFVAKPMEAIRRVGMIPGKEKDAWGMYDKQTDNDRQQHTLDRQNELLRMQKLEKAYGIISNMMGVVRPGDKASWKAMREKATKWLQLNDMEDMVDLIPEDGDMYGVQALQSGNVKTGDQMKIDETHRSHLVNEGLRGESNQIQRERNGVLGAQGNARIGIARDTQQETQRDHALTHQERKTAADLKPNPNNIGRTFVQTPYGVGETTKDRNEVRIPVDPTKLHDPRGRIKFLDNAGNEDPENGKPYLIFQNLGRQKNGKVFWRVKP